MNEEVHEPANTDIEEVAGRVRLVDACIETIHAEREVDRVKVIEIAASKRETADGDSANEERNLNFLACGHVLNRSKCDAKCSFDLNQHTNSNCCTVTAG